MASGKASCALSRHRAGQGAAEPDGQRAAEQPPLLTGHAAAGAAAGRCREAAGCPAAAAGPGAQPALAEHCGQSLRPGRHTELRSGGHPAGAAGVLTFHVRCSLRCLHADGRQSFEL